MFKQVSTTPL
ncbi:hypothetical protein Patl1_15064 [Pistacia atlantica]|uniref:Uncharacterized protein n=1 Tax=Pistacia atlantica TaxID=434234 RepID=A0ACC1B962_9ROSI|nr:hypothetical protein Patl1_15064 [Pistacia atlantica]